MKAQVIFYARINGKERTVIILKFNNKKMEEKNV